MKRRVLATGMPRFTTTVTGNRNSSTGALLCDDQIMLQRKIVSPIPSQQQDSDHQLRQQNAQSIGQKQCAVSMEEGKHLFESSSSTFEKISLLHSSKSSVCSFLSALSSSVKCSDERFAPPGRTTARGTAQSCNHETEQAAKGGAAAEVRAKLGFASVY